REARFRNSPKPWRRRAKSPQTSTTPGSFRQSGSEISSWTDIAAFGSRYTVQPQRGGERGKSIAALSSGEAEGCRQRLAKGVREGADPAKERPAQFLKSRV